MCIVMLVEIVRSVMLSIRGKAKRLVFLQTPRVVKYCREVVGLGLHYLRRFR